MADYLLPQSGIRLEDQYELFPLGAVHKFCQRSKGGGGGGGEKVKKGGKRGGGGGWVWEMLR